MYVVHNSHTILINFSNNLSYDIIILLPFLKNSHFSFFSHIIGILSISDQFDKFNNATFVF